VSCVQGTRQEVPGLSEVELESLEPLLIPLEGALDRFDDALDSIAIGGFFDVAVILC
jgi:hypothetical protein